MTPPQAARGSNRSRSCTDQAHGGSTSRVPRRVSTRSRNGHRESEGSVPRTCRLGSLRRIDPRSSATLRPTRTQAGYASGSKGEQSSAASVRRTDARSAPEPNWRGRAFPLAQCVVERQHAALMRGDEASGYPALGGFGRRCVSPSVRGGRQRWTKAARPNARRSGGSHPVLSVPLNVVCQLGEIRGTARNRVPQCRLRDTCNQRSCKTLPGQVAL